MSTAPKAHRRGSLGPVVGVVLSVVVLATTASLATQRDTTPAAEPTSSAEPPSDLKVMPRSTRSRPAQLPRGQARSRSHQAQTHQAQARRAAARAARWVQVTAQQAGIPERSVRAYGQASVQAPSGCRLGWTTLAGIGYVESAHGTYGGRAIDAAGRSVPPILGPALNGFAGTAAIAAPPAEDRLHTDAQWDHALGPLQFISSTWAEWGRDGDGDGVSDPQDIDDAAAAAAAYLCAAGGDLGTPQGWTRAVYAYNHSADYVRAVYAAAEAYGRRTAGG